MLLLLLLQSTAPAPPLVRTTLLTVHARVEQHCAISPGGLVCRGARDRPLRRAVRLQSGVTVVEF